MQITDRYKIHIKHIIYLTIWILVFNISIIYVLDAQEQSKKEVNDTLVKKTTVNQSLLLGFQSDIIFRKSPIYFQGFLHQSLTNLPVSLSSQFQQQIDVVSPWKEELTKQNEFHTLRTILGAVQASATSYLLYENIKRYGLK